MNVKNEAFKAKLRWQCRRGMLELDILLISFLDNHYDTLSSTEQEVFARLLTEPDPDIYLWLMGKEIPMDPAFQVLITLMRASI
jgi:antitoxin CptB